MTTHLIFFLIFNFFLYNSYSLSQHIIPSPYDTNPAKLPLSNFYASKVGNITLFKDDIGFYVPVDLTYAYSDASTSNTVNMLVGLYTSNTLLVNSTCLNFSTYNCTEYSCNPTENTFSTDFIDFSAEGYYASSVKAYMDYQYWYLGTDALLSNLCNTNTSIPYGSSRSGVIGMGLEGSSLANYHVVDLFSIYLDPYASTGYMIFQTDYVRGAEKFGVASLTADDNWQLDAKPCTLAIKDRRISFSTTMVFDLNTDVIGLPMQIYDDLIANLEEKASMTCANSGYKPVCSYEGKISSLPNIQLGVQGNTIPIVPQIYVANAQNTDSRVSSITLNFKAISNTLKGMSYVTGSYSDAVILGSNFMAYYYVVFDGSYERVVNIFKPPNADASSFPWLYVLVGCIGLVVLVGLGIYMYRRKKVNRKVRQEDSTQDRTDLLANNMQDSNDDSKALEGFIEREERMRKDLEQNVQAYSNPVRYSPPVHEVIGGNQERIAVERRENNYNESELENQYINMQTSGTVSI